MEVKLSFLDRKKLEFFNLFIFHRKNTPVLKIFIKGSPEAEAAFLKMQLEGSQHMRDMEKYKMLVKKLREENSLQGTQVHIKFHQNLTSYCSSIFWPILES